MPRLARRRRGRCADAGSLSCSMSSVKHHACPAGPCRAKRCRRGGADDAELQVYRAGVSRAMAGCRESMLRR
jgi:hypothetical protein